MVDSTHTTEKVDIEQKALANLLDAVEGFLWFSWSDSDLDVDAARAIDRLRLARDEYGTVLRIKNSQSDQLIQRSLK